VLANVAGRANDLIVARSGRFVHAIHFEDLFEWCDGIRRYRFHQHRTGDVDVDLELDRPDPGMPLPVLAQRIESMLEGWAVRIRVVERLDGNRAGKHRWILSDLGASLASEGGEDGRVGPAV
jgi:hypothetical protein